MWLRWTSCLTSVTVPLSENCTVCSSAADDVWSNPAPQRVRFVNPTADPGIRGTVRNHFWDKHRGSFSVHLQNRGLTEPVIWWRNNKTRIITEDARDEDSRDEDIYYIWIQDGFIFQVVFLGYRWHSGSFQMACVFFRWENSMFPFVWL